MLSGLLFGGFARMMMRHAPVIIKCIADFVSNNQKIKLAQLEPPSLTTLNNSTPQTICNYLPQTQCPKQEPLRVQVWKGGFKIGIIGILFFLVLAYLIYDFYLMKTLLQDYTNDQMYIIKILENYRSMAMEFLSFIISWALADQVDHKLFDKKI